MTGVRGIRGSAPAVVVVVAFLAACGGEKLPDRALSAAESAVCTAIPEALEPLGRLNVSRYNAALGIPVGGLKYQLAPMVRTIDAVAAEADSPLRKPMLSFRSAAGHIGSTHVDEDDVAALVTSAVKAQRICEGMDTRFLPKPKEVDFPKISCPGVRTTVYVDTKANSAFTDHDGYDAAVISMDYGDLSGDGYPEVIGSIDCAVQDEDEETVRNVAVMTGGQDGLTQLGQTLRATSGKAVDGALQVKVKGKRGSTERRLYDLVDGRWTPRTDPPSRSVPARSPAS